MAEGIEEGTLNAKARKASAVVHKDGKDKFPIPDKGHARAALGRINQSDLTDEEKARVRARAKAVLKEVAERRAAVDSLMAERIEEWGIGKGGGTTFDPAKHGRDRQGRFAKAIGRLGDGNELELPDGTRVRREGGKLVVHPSRASETRDVPSLYGPEPIEASDPEHAAGFALGSHDRAIANLKKWGDPKVDFPPMPESVRQMGRDLRKLKEAKDSLAKASTPEPFSKSKTSNWVAKAGGLPAYIQHIAHDLMEKRGKAESNAIKMAIGICKNWASGKGNVDANTRAAASKAIAQWEALKAKNAARKAVTASALPEAVLFPLEEGAEAAADTLDVEVLAECAALLVGLDFYARLDEARAAGSAAGHGLDEAWSPQARAAALLKRKAHPNVTDPVGVSAIQGLRSDAARWKTSDAKQAEFHARLDKARAAGELDVVDHRLAERVLGPTHPITMKVKSGAPLTPEEKRHIHDAMRRGGA